MGVSSTCALTVLVEEVNVVKEAIFEFSVRRPKRASMRQSCLVVDPQPLARSGHDSDVPCSDSWGRRRGWWVRSFRAAVMAVLVVGIASGGSAD